MILAAADWGWDKGHIAKFTTDGAANSGQFLILGIILLVVWFLLSAMLGYYFWQFAKTKTDNKIYGKTMLWVNVAMGVVELVIAILVLAFWGNGQKIFGSDDSNAYKDYKAEVALVVIGFIIIVAAIIMMWFFLPYYGIAFDGKRILFMGEDITYASITKIIIDDETRDTYINYTRGKRSHKKLRFSAASAFGLFIQKNSALTGHKAEVADEKAYFQSLMTSDRTAEKEFDKQVNEKIKNKDARTTSAPKKKTTSKDSKKK